jgi:hypothetical protein
MFCSVFLSRVFNVIIWPIFIDLNVLFDFQEIEGHFYVFVFHLFGTGIVIFRFDRCVWQRIERLTHFMFNFYLNIF